MAHKNVVSFKKPDGIKRSNMETKLLALADFDSWQRPRFQRPLRVNRKVFELAEELKHNGGILPGILTLGQIPGDAAIYVVDGFHRIEGGKISGLPEFIGDVCLKEYESMSAMAEDYVRLNSSLVRMRPDDLLRGLEENSEGLHKLREHCDFVGYDQIRRGDSHIVVGMSALLRCWFGSSTETPGQNVGGSSATVADRLDELELQNLIAFLNIAYTAWRNDPENHRLWGNLNLTMCMWLFRQLVLNPRQSKNRRHVQLNVHEFKNCLLGVSANKEYVDYLLGRHMNERDRSSCFRQLRMLFLRRLNADGVSGRKSVVFIKPNWDKN